MLYSIVIQLISLQITNKMSEMTPDKNNYLSLVKKNKLSINGDLVWMYI